MKCLLCDFKSNDLENVRKHYLDFHNVNRNNHFLKKLFKKQKLSIIFWFTVMQVKMYLRKNL